MPQEKQEQKTNCWEFLKCGREPGGSNTQALGICPATIYTPADDFLGGRNGGRACMYITGTFCGNEVQGTYIDKQDKCLQCPFYQQLEKKHGKDTAIESYNKYIRDYYDTLTNDVVVSSTKIDGLLLKMAESYFPFSKISKRRFKEMVDLFRIIEMEESEVIQIRRRKGESLVYVVQGNIDLIQSSSIRSFSTFDLKGKPLLLKKEMGRVSLVCTEPAIIVLVDKQMVEQIVSWDSAFKASRHEIESGAIRRSLLLRRLPPKAIDQIKEKLNKIEVKKGELIMDVGQNNDTYFILQSGKAEVFIENSGTSQFEKISDLKAGDSFGAQSVLSGNLTQRRIIMSEDGALLILKKEDFIEMIKEPLITMIDAETARDMINKGYQALDVRLSEGYEAEHIPGAINIPLQELNERMSELDIGANYIVYSNTGNRSNTASLMLKRNNYQVSSLEKGLSSWPFDKDGSSSSQKTASVYGGVKTSRGASRKRDEVVLKKKSE